MSDALPRVVFTTWVIYERPRDYPRHFVLRKHHVIRGVSQPMAEAECKLADTLEAARALLPPGLHRLGHQPGEDPVIAETWI